MSVSRATEAALMASQMTEEDIKNLQSTGGDHLADTEKNILGNHLDRLWGLVKNMKNGRIDFVLDNAGFELCVQAACGGRLTPPGTATVSTPTG